MVTSEDDDSNVGDHTKPKRDERCNSNQVIADEASIHDNSTPASNRKSDDSTHDSANMNDLDTTNHQQNMQGERQKESAQISSQNDVEHDGDHDNGEDGGPLHKSSRLKGYMTLALASFINYDAAENSSGGIGVHISVVTSSPKQRGFAVAVSFVSLAIATACFIVHLDQFSPLSKFWRTIFKPKSKFEGFIIIFLTIWWTVAVGVNTSVRGPAGDGRGQFSLYYSCWVCCFTCYWMAERWWVAAGLSSFKSFIGSWPNRSPAWICLLILSLTTFIWYLDLWQNHPKLTRPSEALILSHFETVARRQWQWLAVVAIATFCPSIIFVLIELFRGTNADGTITSKSKGEVIVEGCCFFALALAWIPTVMIATTPRGAASLIGNAYFCTWINTIAVCEGLVWYIHDKRRETQEMLLRKKQAYRRRQERILEETLEIQRRCEQKKSAVVNASSGKAEQFDDAGMEDNRLHRNSNDELSDDDVLEV